MISLERSHPTRRRPTLLTDPEGATCPVVPFYRHPFFRKLKWLCHVAMPVAGGVSMLVGIEALQWMLATSGLFLMGVIGALGLSTQHAKLAGGRRRLGRLRAGHRFLCPGCLEFGPVRYSCGFCQREVESFVIDTRGLYLNDCPHCHVRIFARWFGSGFTPGAYCATCEGAFDPRIHRRRVDVLGVMDAADLDTLRELHVAPALEGRGIPYFLGDDGECLTYVLNADEPRSEREELPRTHAVRDLQAIWLDRAVAEPLDLGQVLDRFIRRAALTEAQRRSLRVCVRQPELSRAARNVLEARFETIACGISPERFLAVERFLPPATVEPKGLLIRSPFLEQNC
jgi:hypothetical protein